MEKFAPDANYQEVAAVAKQLKIDYVGVKKPTLIEKINAKIDAIASGEAEAPAPVQETEVATEGTETSGEATETTRRRGRTAPSERQPRVKKAKWFEEEGANLPYAEGSIVEVHSGEILVGRKAQVVKMSAKQNAVKAILIHPVKGTLQGCTITLDYDKIKMAEDQSAPKTAEEAVATEAEVKAPETEVAAGNEAV